MKIGLYTFHADHNVGAMLQAYALSRLIKELGKEVEIVNIYPKELERNNFHKGSWKSVKGILKNIYVTIHPTIQRKSKKFEDFHNLMPLSERYLSKEEYIRKPKAYDIHLVGSDQVWNCQKGYDKSRLFFLDYLKDNDIRVSYGSSFGTTKLNKDEQEISLALSKFNKISVREDTGVEYVTRLTGKKCDQVLDPTLLVSSQTWDEIIGESFPYKLEKGQYIFFYGVNTDLSTWSLLRTARERLNLPIVGFPGLLHPKYTFDQYIIDSGPLDFIRLIKNAALVITSSFHGLAFSVNYKKDFILVKYGERMERMESLVRLLQLQKHYANNTTRWEECLSNAGMSMENENLLEKEREKSLSYLTLILK